MDVSDPIRSVIPSADAEVLSVLARTEVPLSARRLASLTRSHLSHVAVRAILDRLSEAGVVVREPAPPARLYRLNHDHVATPGILSLVGMREELFRRLRELVAGWPIPAVAVWLFGSAARADGTATSDLDVLVVRPDQVDGADQTWLQQSSQLAERAHAWAGNSVEILEMTASELAAALQRGDRLIEDLRTDAVVLSGRRPRHLLRPVPTTTAPVA